ncbi:hypothetical protein [Paenibacillus sp. FSL K6-2524]
MEVDMENIQPEFRRGHTVDRNGCAVASFISSLVGLFLFVILLVNDVDDIPDSIFIVLFLPMIILPILGVIFGSLSFNSMRGKGMGIAGFVISVILLLLIFLLLIAGSMV